MKIAISSDGKSLDSEIDPRFGQCAYFLIIETDDMSFEAFKNENLALGGGAGIQSAQFVASKGAKAIITGNCGPNAVRTLSAADIEMFVGQNGGVRETIESYKRGDMTSATGANVADHYGMADGFAQGYGMGMGRATTVSRWAPPNRPGSGSLPRQEELNQSKDLANDLDNQIEVVESRIRNLDKKWGAEGRVSVLVDRKA